MNLKELEKLMKLCHKYNVKTISVEGVTLSIDNILPQKIKHSKIEEKPSDNEPIYTDEDILMWSAGGV